MDEIKKVICITCPKGCTLEVTQNGQTITDVKNGCSRGHAYVKAELIDPRRMIASTVKVKGGVHPLVPVYTESPFPKPQIFDLVKVIRVAEVQAPVKAGQVIIEDALGTGINVVASRDMPAA